MIRKATLFGAYFFGLLMMTPLIGQIAQAQSATPVTNDDFYNVKEDSMIAVAAPGIFDNDDLSADSLVLELVSQPTNGTVTLNEDGSFEYTPNLGFDGIDSFSYLIKTVPKQVLQVDTSQSALNFDMAIFIPLFGTDFEDDTGRVGGEASFFLTEDGPSSFSEGHLYDLDLVIVDSLELEFRYGLTNSTKLFVNADSAAFNLKMTERGEPAPVSNGSFTQMMNNVNVAGTAKLKGTRTLGALVPDDPQEFDTDTQADITMNVDLAPDSTLSISVPVLLEEEFELSVADVDLKVEGWLVASGEYNPPLSSNIATVNITVEPIFRTDVDREVPYQYALSQNYPNPFNPVTTIEYSIPTSEFVTLKVFDTLGREVANLVEGFQAPGIHEIQFNAGNLPSGMYVYRLTAQDYSEVKKLLLLK